MLINTKHWQQLRSQLSILINSKDRVFLKLLIFSLSGILSTAPTLAAEEVLGVVKSPENAHQWSEITNRLERVGIKYCIVDARDWQEELDFGMISVLLLPNVDTINSIQARSLQQWMNRGGKAIITGSTGNLSQPSTRDRLRTLFGAYWGFSNSSTATLELSHNTPVEWYGRANLSGIFTGGSLIPVGTNSKTAAIWIGEKDTPAAVITNNTTFLGWRWGFDNVAPVNIDTAWLQAALNRYGITTYGRFTPVAYTNPQPCRPSIAPREESRPFLPNLQTPLEQSQSNGFFLEPTLSSTEIQSMTQELEGLIGRFESTLLSADAYNSNVNSSTSQVIEQLLSDKTKSNKQLIRRSQSNHQDAHQALQEARDGLKKFDYLAKQRSFSQAKREWSNAKNILWQNYPSDRPIAQPEIRAMWLDRGTIVKAKSEADLAEIFDRMATAGINTVFFETLNAGYTIYPSRVAPEQNPLTKGWDPLKAAVKLAHERGMELHAWVWTFATANQRHNIILNQPRSYLGPVLSRHPDWAITDREGNHFHYHSGKVFLDPANRGVRYYLSSLIDEIATNYDVDGIHLDYIRYPFQDPTGKITYGYGLAARQEFREMTGIDPLILTPKDALWSQWSKFRIEQIDSFVGSVARNLKQKRPDLILSTAVFPMPRQERLEKIQQHWEEWIARDWIDMLVPMTYAEDTETLQKLTIPVLRGATLGNTLILPGIRLLNISDVAALDQKQFLRGITTDGYALFAAENLTEQLATMFSRTQGDVKLLAGQSLPYRHPFEVTLSRYQKLQKEWNFFLSNHQLTVEEVTLKQWGQQADKLATNLQILAQEPSVKNYLSTQLALSSFRRQFPRWMKQTKSINDHQAQVWENRLGTLDRLLSYGEKRVLKGKNII
ncbi:MAG: glycoside hydrolase family 10 protein [Pleurocapsa sp.]